MSHFCWDGAIQKAPSSMIVEPPFIVKYSEVRISTVFLKKQVDNLAISFKFNFHYIWPFLKIILKVQVSGIIRQKMTWLNID